MGDMLVNTVQIPVPMIAYLVVSLIMLFAGVYGFLTRKNLIMI